MIRIGIVGAENTHAAAIARMLNVHRKIPGARVVALWGETPEFAAKTAEAGRIPTIVKRPKDMLGLIDGVMIDHRHAKCHLPAAEPFLAAGIPMFIDKPFCYRSAAGRDFLRRARRKKVPVTSFSTVALSASVTALKKELAKAGRLLALVTSGPCDIHSKYGGVFFYGIHQVDAAMKLVGSPVVSVQANCGPGDSHTATLHCASGLVVTVNLLKGFKVGFHFLACCEDGLISHQHKGDPDPYLTGAKTFVKMFRTGVEPICHDDILAPIRALEAIERSIRTGKRVKL